jgi:hypothetical protein
MFYLADCTIIADLVFKLKALELKVQFEHSTEKWKVMFGW